MPRRKQQAEPKVEPQVEYQRAHNEDGTFRGDDPSTPEVNEAFEPPKPTPKRSYERGRRVGAPTVGTKRVYRTSVGTFNTRVSRKDA